jgi:hypothetical protein
VGSFDLITHFPFGPESFVDDRLANSADLLIKINTGPNCLNDWDVESPEKYFCIGDDASEEPYYIDLSRTISPVFVADVEIGTFTEVATDLKTWIAGLMVLDEQIKKEEADSRRKWWW